MNAATVPNWHANLDLAFERRDASTVLIRNRHSGPLQVQKALYPEGRETCHIAVLHPPGGIVAGDRLTIRASLGAGSRALLTTPGAAKWYRSEAERARQELHFSAAGDAMLEWLPRENIFFDGSKISMSLDVDLSAQARYFGWEILSFGRRASGEAWRRGSLEMRTSIRREGRPVWLEIAHLDAGGGFAKSALGLSGFTVCGAFVVAGGDIDRELLAACRAARPPDPAIRLGVTRVPGVLIARYLGHSTEEAFDWFTVLWRILRPALTTRAACAPRVWAC